jgi:hypothetical protein
MVRPLLFAESLTGSPESEKAMFSKKILGRSYLRKLLLLVTLGPRNGKRNKLRNCDVRVSPRLKKANMKVDLQPRAGRSFGIQISSGDISVEII